MCVTPKIFGLELSDLHQLLIYFAQLFGTDLKQAYLEAGIEISMPKLWRKTLVYEIELSSMEDKQFRAVFSSVLASDSMYF